MNGANRQNKHECRLSFQWLGLIVLILMILVLHCECPKAIKRPGSSWDGSAKWAAELARPEILAAAADAKIYTILGVRIYKDGRLPQNVGDWSITAWSASDHKEITVVVDHEGNLRTTVSQSTTPPVNSDPLPDDWVTNTSWCNSTDAFAVIPNFPANFRDAPEVSFNHIYCPSEDSLRDQPQWQILLDELLYSHFILYTDQYIGYCHI